MPGNYFVVTLNCGARNAPNDAIEAALAPPYDWLRFSRDSYYVYAPIGAFSLTIYSLLKPLLHADDLILVTQINGQERHGWVSVLAKEWFDRHRA